MPDAKITPCLWFDRDAEAAATFYVTLLPDSRVDRVSRAPADYPSGRAGDVLTVDFTLAGHPYVALNGGPSVTFNQGVSFMIATDDQAETDRLYAAILDNGGTERACGWVADRWGLHWQVTPRRLLDLMKDPDRAKARRVMEAMMTMRKIDIAVLDRAAAAPSSADDAS